MKPIWLISILPTALLATASPARAADVSVLVVPRFPPAAYADNGAVGLFVPGAGETVSRRAALASLLRGKVEKSVLGGVPGGRPLIRLARRPGRVTIYVALPPAGAHPNTRRYPIAVVGGGYRGILTSRSTRIRGLVSIADVAPSALALARGRRPTIRSSTEADAPASLARLDRTIARRRDVRLGSTLVLALSVLGLSLVALATRSRYIGRAALLAAPAALGGSLVLSAADVTRPGPVLALLAALTLGGCLAGAAPARLLPALLCALVVAYFVVLLAWPEVNSLAPIGPHVESGGRFYGVTNLLESVLLTVSIQAAALLPRVWLAPIALLALVTVGWSRTGADGGGLLVLGAAFGVLAVRRAGARLTPRVAAAAVAGAVALGAALVGLDAAAGGSSHVTRAVGHPISTLGDLGHRIHLSAAIFASSWHAALVITASLGALAVLRASRPRFPAGDALLVGIVVSLVVNDSPNDVAAAGVISYGVLWTWERVRARPREGTLVVREASRPLALSD